LVKILDKKLALGNLNPIYTQDDNNKTKSYSPTDKQNYEDDRLEKQRQRYSKKARQNKLRYRFYQIIIMIISANIPIINLIDLVDLQTRIVSSILGTTILIITGITQLEKYQEYWIIYRTSAELLKKEKYFFENDAGDYANLPDENAKRKLLVERVESLISSETNKYFTIHQPQKPPTSQSNDKSSKNE
jgi:hypothetical protein